MTDSIPETRTFRLRRPGAGVLAIGVTFDPGPVVVYTVADHLLRVYASLDEVGRADESAAGAELVWQDGPVGYFEPEFLAELRKLNIEAGGPVTMIGGVPRRGVEDSEPAEVATPGRRYAFTEIPTDHGSILIRDDALYPERGPA